jgi:hypothetical protein
MHVNHALAQLYEPCDCHKRNKHEMHYISFDETFQRLREVTDDVLEHLGSRRDVLKFVLGQTYVLPKEGKAFDSFLRPIMYLKKNNTTVTILKPSIYTQKKQLSTP